MPRKTGTNHRIMKSLKEAKNAKEIQELCNYVFDNDHEQIRKFVLEHSHVSGTDTYVTQCGCPACFPEKASLIEHLLCMGHGDCTVPVTIETFALLIELGLIKKDNIDFLEKYASQCNCAERWKSFVGILKMFDPVAMKEYRTGYNTTLLHGVLYSHYDADVAEINAVLSYLIDEVKIDVTVRSFNKDVPLDEQDHKHTIMPLVIGQCNVEMIEKLSAMGLDVNEFDGHDGRSNMTPIMWVADSIGQWMNGVIIYFYGDPSPRKKPDDEHLAKLLNELYDTLVCLKKLGYDFSVKNERRATDSSYVTKTRVDAQYGHTLSDIITKWGFVEKDVRFAEFV